MLANHDVSSGEIDRQCDVAYELGAAGHSWTKVGREIDASGLPGWALADLQEAWRAGSLASHAPERRAA